MTPEISFRNKFIIQFFTHFCVIGITSRNIMLQTEKLVFLQSLLLLISNFGAFTFCSLLLCFQQNAYAHISFVYTYYGIKLKVKKKV